MTALGTHEHFRCDQCQTKVVQPVAVKPGVMRGNPVTTIAINTGGSRLDGIHHLCASCRTKLDTHFFGPIGCDGPKVIELERLLRRARTALLSQRAHEEDEYIGSDIDAYFDPPISIPLGDEP